MRTTILLFLSPLIFFVTNCTTNKSDSIDIPEHVLNLENVTVYSATEEPTYEITLEREITFGDTEDEFLGYLYGMVVDDTDRVYIIDSQTKTIHAYDSDGSHIGSMGREGQGPGEFQFIHKLRVSDGQLVALDSNQYKISIFDKTTFAHIVDINPSVNDESKENQPSWVEWLEEGNRAFNYRVIDFYINTDGKYIIIFGDRTAGSLDNFEGRTWEVSLFDPVEKSYLAHDLQSLKGDLNAIRFDRLTLAFVLFKPNAFMDSNGQQMVYGFGAEMLFKFYDSNGVYQRAFYYDHPNFELKLDDLIARYDEAYSEMIESRNQIREGLRNTELPESWPAFHNLKIDDENRIWVATRVEDQSIYEWWVLQDTGELISKFELPRDQRIEAIRNGFLYTLETDDDSGVGEIVRYRIHMEAI